MIVGAPDASGNASAAFVAVGQASKTTPKLATPVQGFRIDSGAASNETGFSMDAADDADKHARAGVIGGAPLLPASA